MNGKGSFIYKNRVVQQHADIKEKLIKLFESSQPARILEIGTSYGGLTVLMRDTLNEINMSHVPIRTYDIIYKCDFDQLNNIDNIDFIKKNIFNHNGKGSELDCEEAKKYITGPGKVIVFADGGNKKDEFAALAKHIKSGDIIMAHDYVETKAIWEESYKGKIWNWCEVIEKDLETACEDNNLSHYMQEEMRQVVWACRVKN